MSLDDGGIGSSARTMLALTKRSPPWRKSGFERAPAASSNDKDAAFLLKSSRRPHLILIGAAHVAQVLAPMAQLAGFDVVVVDPRMAFSAKERFPHARVMSQWPDVAPPSPGLDPFNAVATLTHDPKIDDLALRLALASDCFYVGALGSKKTHARRVERLVASEIEPAALARPRAPIGLDIGASSPAEIAVSALGEFAGRMASKRHGLRFEGRPLARGKIQRADEQIAYLAVTATPEGSQAGA
jgi:xanthine/CO dehydrogenase XdhC/CoxF family maturation factor